MHQKNSGDSNRIRTWWPLRIHDLYDNCLSCLASAKIISSIHLKTALHKHSFLSFIVPFTWTREPNNLTCSQLSGFIALVGKSTAPASQRSKVRIQFKSPEFFRCMYNNCLSCLANLCEDHFFNSSLNCSSQTFRSIWVTKLRPSSRTWKCFGQLFPVAHIRSPSLPCLVLKKQEMIKIWVQ